MRTIVLGLTAAVVLASPAWARPYTVDKAASRLGFTASMGGQPINGTFRRWDATIDFDAANLPGSRASVTVDMSSASMGDGTRDAALPGADFFATGKFPRATFVTRSITRVAPDRYQATGDLTIRGVKRPVSLPFTLQVKGNTARMQGRLTLDRTAFGVGQGQAAAAVGKVRDGQRGRHRQNALTCRRARRDERGRARRRGASTRRAGHPADRNGLRVGGRRCEQRAVARLFEAKGRPRFNPLIAHVADTEAAERLASFDDRARALAEAFWPGR
jgi:polyisoprenoid-binding protein YceI